MTGSPEERSPEDVARTAFQALTEQRWLDFARDLDPSELEQFYSERLRWVKRHSERPPTAEHFLRTDPDMPRAVAEYLAQRSLQHLETSATSLSHMYAGVTSVAELASLSPVELFARHLQAQDPREKARRVVVGPAAQNAGAKIVTLDWRVLGVVLEATTLAHVVYRLSWSEAEGSLVDFPRVATLRQSAADWRFLLDPGDFGLQNWVIEPATSISKQSENVEE